MNMRYYRVGCIAIAAFLISACNAPESPEQKAANTETVMTVTVMQVKEGVLQSTLEAHGKAVPREDVSVATDLAGLSVIEVSAEEGSIVEKGQVLARLDTAGLQYTLDSLEADLAKATRDNARGRELRKLEAMSREEVEQREAAYLMLQARAGDARLRLQKAVIVAPASGMIYQRNAIVGAITQMDQPLFKIAANKEIELEVTIPEAFTHAISLETPVVASLVGDSGKKPATIRLVSPRIDPVTRTANVRLTFPYASFIPVHTFCTARFSLPPQKGLLVVSTAVQQDALGTYVWIVRDDNTVLRQNVTITARGGTDVLIEGVENNQTVVARAGAFLQEGDQIQRSGEAQ